MDSREAWEAFLQTGTVTDYLRYATVKRSKEGMNDAAHGNGNGDSQPTLRG